MALHKSAADLSQLRRMLQRFDTFSDNHPIKGLCQLHHAHDDGEVGRVSEHVAYEALVNFQGVDWKAAQVGK